MKAAAAATAASRDFWFVTCGESAYGTGLLEKSGIRSGARLQHTCACAAAGAVLGERIWMLHSMVLERPPIAGLRGRCPLSRG